MKTAHKILLIAILFLSLAVVITNCGGDDNGDTTNGNGNDTTPPTVIDASPSDGATKVSVLTDIKVTVSESLDSSTVNSSTVTLRYNPTVNGAVSYDDTTKTITFTPFTSLAYDTTRATTIFFSYGTTYVSTLSGITDLANNTMSDTTISFTTYKNPFSQAISYSLGIVSDYSTFTYDANGNRTQSVKYNGAGADNIWFTSDDIKWSETTYETSF